MSGGRYDTVKKPNHFVYYTFGCLRLSGCTVGFLDLLRRPGRRYIFFDPSKISGPVEFISQTSTKINK
jgi:hypothetical protein